MYIKIRNTTNTSANIMVDEPTTLYVVEKDGLVDIINVVDSCGLANLTPSKKYCISTSNENESATFITYPDNYTSHDYDPLNPRMALQIDIPPPTIITYDNHPPIPDIHQIKGDGV